MIGNLIRSAICSTYDTPFLRVVARRARAILSYQSAAIARELAARSLFERTEGVVQRGPFSGLRMTRRGSNSLVLFGLYEEELHGTIYEFSKKKYDLIINIGCANGYYAVGLARMFPHAMVRAFDVQLEMLNATREVAELNRATDRLEVGGALTSEQFIDHIRDAHNPLVFMDIEGAEWSLLSDAAVAECAAADMIIECHCGPESERMRVVRALSQRHRVKALARKGRNPFVLPEFSDLGFAERDLWMIVSEERSASQGWIVAVADVNGTMPYETMA